MPISGLLSAAALGGVGQTIWQYNREKLRCLSVFAKFNTHLQICARNARNYMFDVPLRQAREFQVQNVNLARDLAKS